MAIREDQYENGRAVLTPDGFGYMAGLNTHDQFDRPYPRPLDVHFGNEIRTYRLEDCYIATLGRYLFGNPFGFGRVAWGNMAWIYGLLTICGYFVGWHPVWIVTAVVITAVIIVQSWMQFRLKVR